MRMQLAGLDILVVVTMLDGCEEDDDSVSVFEVGNLARGSGVVTV